MSLLRPLSFICRATAAPALRAPAPITAQTLSAALPINHQQVRSKHSATQVKRLFNKNPARIRLLKQRGVKKAEASLPERTYPAIFKPHFLGNGWSAPPGEDLEGPEYPFRVTRTGRKPFGTVGFLPVYRDIR